jgi:hypothetical protein
MSLAPGEVDLTPTDIDAWLHELAATLVAIHATGIEAEQYESWIPSALPAWAERDELEPCLRDRMGASVHGAARVPPP